MQNQLHQETVKEIAKVKAYLGHLEAMRSFLEGGGVPAGKANSDAGKAARPVRKRAPAGSFQATLLALFSAGETLSNANVRDRLKAIKHPPTDKMHVRKTLTKMAKGGKLVAVRDGEAVAYRLP